MGEEANNDGGGVPFQGIRHPDGTPKSPPQAARQRPPEPGAEGTTRAGAPYGSPHYLPDQAGQGRQSLNQQRGQGPARQYRTRWWTIPKVVIAGAIAVLLAGAGGGAIGYGVGTAGTPHRPGIGQYGHYRGNFGPGGGSGGGPQLPGQAPNGQAPNGPGSSNL